MFKECGPIRLSNTFEHKSYKIINGRFEVAHWSAFTLRSRGLMTNPAELETLLPI